MATTNTHITYGVPVSLSVQKANKSQRQQRFGFSYPLVTDLTTTVASGYLKQATSQANYFNKSSGVTLIRNNLRQLLLTEKGSRVMLPEYGLDLKRYLFEPLDETTFFLIRRDILNTLNNYFSIAKPLSLKVFSEERDTENNRLIVDLTLQLMDESLDIFDVEVTLG